MDNQALKKKPLCTGTRFLPGLLIIIGALAYANSLSGPFIFDDKPNILDNAQVQRLWPLSEAMSAPEPSGVSGRPILCLSLALNYAISKYSVWSYHLVNVIIHLLAGLALYGIVRRTLLSKRLQGRFGNHAAGLAWITATIWVVHPIQTGSVTYIIQRAESLMGMFYLLTLYAAVRAMGSRRAAVWSVVSVACCGLGMMTKEVAVTAPLIVLLYDRAFTAGSFFSALRQRWSLYAGLAGTWGILAMTMRSSSYLEIVAFSIDISPFDYALNQFIVVAHYLRLCVWPAKLCLHYNWPVVKEFDKILPSMPLIVAMLAVTAWGLARNRNWGYLGAWFFGILAPTSSFAPLQNLAFEHRLYLSLAAPIVLVVTGGYILLGKAAGGMRSDKKSRAGPIGGKGEHWFGVVLAIAVIASLALATAGRNEDYRSAVSIWQKVIEVEPGNHEGYNNLGNALKSEGKLDEAIGQYRQALSIKPDHVMAHYNLGLALSVKGELDEAIGQYRQALSIKPDHAKAHYNLGLALSAKGELDEAISHYRQAVQIKPDHALAYNNLGNALQLQGNVDEAISCYLRSLEIEPNSALSHTNLGNILQLQGKPDEAISHYRQALGIEPDYAPALNNLAWLLATYPEARIRNASQAIGFAERAAELTKYEDAGVLDTLAAAYAERGDFEKAGKYVKEAIKIARGRTATSVIMEYEEHLAAYKANKPWRQ